MTRTAAREIAIQLGFSVIGTGTMPEQAVERFFEPDHYASLKEESDLYREPPSKKDMDFILTSVCGVWEHRKELDEMIERYAKRWRTQRISRSAVAVLRQAIFEMMYMPDIPAAASINAAVELAKNYDDSDVVSFVNGILGGFYRGEIAPEANQNG